MSLDIVIILCAVGVVLFWWLIGIITAIPSRAQRRSGRRSVYNRDPAYLRFRSERSGSLVDNVAGGVSAYHANVDGSHCSGGDSSCGGGGN